MREDIELATHKLYFSRHDRVVANANHENVSSYSLGGGLAFTFRDFISGLVLALLLLRRFAGRCPLLREPPPPRNFLIIFCVVSVTCFDRMSPVCPGLAAISVMTFAPVRKASRPTDLALLHSTGRTVLYSSRRKLPIPRPRCTNGGAE